MAHPPCFSTHLSLRSIPALCVSLELGCCRQLRSGAAGPLDVANALGFAPSRCSSGFLLLILSPTNRIHAFGNGDETEDLVTATLRVAECSPWGKCSFGDQHDACPPPVGLGLIMRTTAHPRRSPEATAK